MGIVENDANAWAYVYCVTRLGKVPMFLNTPQEEVETIEKYVKDNYEVSE